MGKVKIVANRLGVCPYCESQHIYYEPAIDEADMLYYPCVCKDCNRYFEEWYSLHFEGYNVGPYGEHEASDVLGKEIDYE